MQGPVVVSRCVYVYRVDDNTMVVFSAHLCFHLCSRPVSDQWEISNVEWGSNKKMFMHYLLTKQISGNRVCSIHAATHVAVLAVSVKVLISSSPGDPTEKSRLQLCLPPKPLRRRQQPLTAAFRKCHGHVLCNFLKKNDRLQFIRNTYVWKWTTDISQQHHMYIHTWKPMQLKINVCLRITSNKNEHQLNCC